MVGQEDELRTTDGVLLSELLDIRSEPEVEEEVIAEQAQARTGSSRRSSKARKRALSVVTLNQITKGRGQKVQPHS